MSQLNSRWRKNAQRYSDKRTVEIRNWVRHPLSGALRLVRKSVTEVLFVQLAHEAYGWKNGAKVRKV